MDLFDVLIRIVWFFVGIITLIAIPLTIFGVVYWIIEFTKTREQAKRLSLIPKIRKALSPKKGDKNVQS